MEWGVLMARYIDADKFLEDEIKRNGCVPLVGVSKYINGEESFEGDCLDALINEQPTADVVEVKHGEWIWMVNGEEDYEQYWVCSVCGGKDYIETNYCPNCGAKMDGERK